MSLLKRITRLEAEMNKGKQSFYTLDREKVIAEGDKLVIAFLDYLMNHRTSNEVQNELVKKMMKADLSKPVPNIVEFMHK